MKNKRSICIRLKGGLGNQLFQYAFARSVSLQFNYRLIIDTKTGYYFDNYERIARVDKFLKGYNKAGFLSYILFYITKHFPQFSQAVLKSRLITEKNNTELIQINQYVQDHRFNITFIEGYYQSPIYFQGIDDILRNEINISPNINVSDMKYMKLIDSSESVAVHVRRIDYSDTLDISYYIEAIKLLSNKIIKPTYFIFSDDINWCRNEFHFLDDVCYVETNSNDELTDLYLMTRCANFIIANSSFSWWGAYLSRYENKIVVAPVKSTIETSKKNYPNNWICI